MEICPPFGFDLHDMPSKSSFIKPIKTYSSLKATSPQAIKKYGTLNKKFKRLRINYPETSSLALKKIITRLPYLERVTVIFTDFDPKFESKTKFLQAFFRRFNRLKHLNFDFGWCDRISNKSLLFLRPALYKLPGLTKLEINFEWCSNLSEASINSVWKGIAKLKNLENLVLKLTGCDKVSNKSVRCLRNSLTNLRNLKRICLELKRCHNVTDEGLQILLDGVIKIRALQSLTIDLEDSHKICDLNLLQSKKKYEKTHKMQVVGLNFSECFRIFELGLELPWVEDIWANSGFFRKLAFNLRGKDFVQKSYSAHLQKKLYSCNSEFETQVLSLL